MQRHQIISARTGKVEGLVIGRKFYKFMRRDGQFLHTPPAIAFDICTLRLIARTKAEAIVVVDPETDNVYEATMDKMRSAGFMLDRGMGPQWAMKLTDWTQRERADLDETCSESE